MKHLLPLLALLLCLVSCNQLIKTFTLDNWEFEYQDAWLQAEVPGCIHTDLMAHNIIPDPFYGTNEDSVQWVSDREWHYRTTFCKEDLFEGWNYLVFDGLQTYATVLLNGEVMAQTDNMFRCLKIPINKDEQPDTNCLEVIFRPTAPCDSAMQAELGYELPDRRAFTRTAPYQQGWDWGPKLNTCGLWMGVHIDDMRLDYEGNDIQEPVRIAKSSYFNKHTITFEATPDSIGLAYTFYDNGEPVFVKGANWIPCHSFPVLTPALKERYRYLLTSAKEANFNMLRVWGGGIYEHDYFFDLCDSLGIMVWMDFNFSCALYPSDSNAIENIKEEARQQVKRIAVHPCVVLWCGNNEVKNGWEDWGWQAQYGWTPEQQAELQQGMDAIFGEDGWLAWAVHQFDPLHRPYISSSPLYGWGHPECVTHGDSHYWGVWWGEEPFEMYKEKTGRFMSEYGFQSYPDYSTICRFCPQEERNIESPTMRNHQKHGRGREIIDKAMMQYYGVDSKSLSLEDYCYVSQLLQAWGTGYGILQHLLAQPRCMGTLYWQLDDCWPVASWSSIDYYGNWKALQYRARDLFADDADLNAWEQYYQTYPKDLQLRLAKFNLQKRVGRKGTSLWVSVKADVDLRDVMLQTQPHVDGHFESNYFDLSAGEERRVRFIPRDPECDLSMVNVSVRTLNDILAK